MLTVEDLIELRREGRAFPYLTAEEGQRLIDEVVLLRTREKVLLRELDRLCGGGEQPRITVIENEELL